MPDPVTDSVFCGLELKRFPAKEFLEKDGLQIHVRPSGLRPNMATEGHTLEGAPARFSAKFEDGAWRLTTPLGTIAASFLLLWSGVIQNFKNP